jgi:hypothetical protein
MNLYIPAQLRKIQLGYEKYECFTWNILLNIRNVISYGTLQLLLTCKANKGPPHVQVCVPTAIGQMMVHLLGCCSNVCNLGISQWSV